MASIPPSLTSPSAARIPSFRNGLLPVATGIAVVLAISWAYVICMVWGMANMQVAAEWLLMPSMSGWGGMDLLLVFVMWAIMMAAMMLPSAVPLLLLLTRINYQRYSRRRAFLATSIFGLGYLGVWTAFSVFATLAQWGLLEARLVTPMMDSSSAVLSSALLLAAGAYQFTALKEVCLSRCRSPLSVLMTHSREGILGAFLMGLASRRVLHRLLLAADGAAIRARSDESDLGRRIVSVGGSGEIRAAASMVRSNDRRNTHGMGRIGSGSGDAPVELTSRLVQLHRGALCCGLLNSSDAAQANASSYRRIAMVELLVDPQAWIAFLTLTALELVLGIDNIIFISILVDKLPKIRQELARRIGLFLAMFMRIALLLVLSWLVGLTVTLFTVLRQEISGRDLILIAGGIFLLWKSTKEIHQLLEGEKGEASTSARAQFSSIIVQVVIIDLVFSLDSIITAVGMVDEVSVMIAAVIASVLLMLAFAGAIGRFVSTHPTIKMLALSFLFLIGTVLIADGFEHHVPKGYVYFAMAFSVLVEMLNIRMRKRKARPVELRDRYTKDPE